MVSEASSHAFTKTRQKTSPLKIRPLNPLQALQATVTFFRRSLSRKITGLYHVLRHLLHPHNPKFLLFRSKTIFAKNAARKYSRISLDNLLVIERHVSREFWRVFFKQCTKRGIYVKKRKARYPRSQRKDEVNIRLNIAGTLLGRAFQHRYHFKTRILHVKPIFDFVEFLRPFTYLIVYDTLEYRRSRLKKAVLTFLKEVRGYCDHLYYSCSFVLDSYGNWNVQRLLKLAVSACADEGPTEYLCLRVSVLLWAGFLPVEAAALDLGTSLWRAMELLKDMAWIRWLRHPVWYTKRAGLAILRAGRQTRQLTVGQTRALRIDVEAILDKELVTTVDDLCDRLKLSLWEGIYFAREMGKKKTLFTYFTIPHPILLGKRLGVLCRAKIGRNAALDVLAERITREKRGRVIPQRIPVPGHLKSVKNFTTALNLYKTKTDRFIHKRDDF